ncbi:ZIP family metal transporter [candidate division WOR-3 bacterium]|nr:ZIP family metal transporter [candidate division WOR-3 bacterium]
MKLALIISFALLGSVCSVGLAGLLLLLKGKQLRFVTGSLIPYAVGTLLGAAFFGMIPHAMLQLAGTSVLPTVLFGIILFYVLEKLALWRHCHEQPCDVHTRAGTMILIGDSLHNFVDGVAITAAFTGSVPLGIATSVAVIAHEVPQEVGDFAILLESGYSRSRAFLYNALSSLTALLGAVLTYFLLPFIQPLVPYLLSVSAASFIYIALADIVPGRRAVGGLRSLAWELPLMVLGMGTIFALRLDAGR